MTRLMFDSTTVGDIPADARMVAFYVDGLYAEHVTSLRQRFPHAQLVSITVLGKPGAQVADIEKGDLTPASGAAWAKREVEAKRQPTIYCSESLWPAVKRAVAAAGLRSSDVSYWIAHYDNKPGIPTGAVAKQYRSTSKPNLDTSVVADYWPGVDPKPAAKKTAPKPVMPPKAPAGPSTRQRARALLLHRLHLLHLFRLRHRPGGRRF